MNKKLLISLLSVLVLSSAVVMAEDTTTSTRPEPPKFENGTPPDFVKGQPPQGQPPQINGENGQKGQFEGRLPSKRPDAKPGGDRKPPEWDSSNNNGQPPKPPGVNNGVNVNGNNSNGRPPLPQKQKDTTSSES